MSNKKISPISTPITKVSVMLMLCMAAIGTIFVYKYGIRIADYAAIVSVAFFALFFVVTGLILTSNSKRWNSTRLFFDCAFGVMAVMVAVLFTVDFESNNVDRWSAIHNFLSYLLQGNYPYAAETHLGGYGSPFPVWQIWHLPYYLLGNVGLSSVVCVALFLYSLWKSDGTVVAFKALAILSLCPSFWYEVGCMSDLLSNMLLLGAYLNWFLHRTEKNGFGSARFLLANAVVCGLFFSTRLVVIVPICYAMYRAWKAQDMKTKALLIVAAACVFALTIVPFAFWDKDMLFFFEHNPFALQSRQSDFSDVVLLAVSIVLLCVFYSKNRTQVMIASAFTLFTFIAYVFCHKMFTASFELSFWSSSFDHTYLGMCLPFALMALLLTRRQ